MSGRTVPLWALLVGASSLVVLLLTLLDISVTKTTIYLGLTFLALTLIPIHFKKLARYRRDFGIVSGILITLHGIFAFNTYMNASFLALFHQTIINGYLATIIIVVLLITSNYGVQRRLGNRWRVIHAFIWFSLPLSLLHALMASRYYTSDFPVLALLLIGGLGIFGVGKIVLPKTNLRENLRDASLVLLGTGFAIGIVLLYPVSGESLNNVPKEYPTGEPTASESVQPTIYNESITVVPAAESTNSPTATPPSAVQEYTMQDLAQHSSQSDCYVAYQSVVYDITTYLPNHPGGARKAARMCGQNIDSFSDQHEGGSFSSAQAQEVLAPLQVGQLQ